MGVRQSILVIVMIYSAAVQGLAAPEPPFQRVRALDAVLIRSLREGFRRSPTFRSIVLELERSNVIVYVTPGVCELGRVAGCLLRFVGVSGNDRYVRVLINPVLSEDRTIGVVGHELQHVREVAAAPEVSDGRGLRDLFRQIGFRECRGVIGECYETKAAIDAEDAILKELGKQHHFTRR